MKHLKVKGLVFALTVLMALTLVSGCSTTDISGGGQLVFTMWSSAEGLFNENLSESVYDSWSHYPVFDGMLRHNPDLSHAPSLAEEWDISDDGLTFSFKLRDDISFHDGVKVTTEDVAFTFMWMMHPDYTGIRYSNFQYVVGAQDYKDGIADAVEGIEIINDREIKFHMSQVDAPAFDSIATWGISPAHVFDGTPISEIDRHEAISAPIGTGPFKFVNWVEGQFVELERYDDYHLGAPKLERLIIKTANQDVAQAELMTGNTDIADVNPNAEDFMIYEATAGMPVELRIAEFPSRVYQYMAFNMKDGIFSDKAVRHAATYATDRQSMVDGLLDGFASVATSHMAPVSWARHPDLEPRPFDPAKAVTVLEGAGWVKGSDGVYQKDGQKLEFNLLYPTGNEVRMDSAIIIKDNLEAVGFSVNLEIMDFNTLMARVFDDPDNRDFDAFLMGWQTGLDPDAEETFHPESYWNAMGLDHPDNLRLLQAGRGVVEQSDRLPFYLEWQELLYEEAPYAWLYAPNQAWVYNSKLQEFKPNGFGHWWDLHLWHWADDAEETE